MSYATILKEKTLSYVNSFRKLCIHDHIGIFFSQVVIDYYINSYLDIIGNVRS